MGRDREGPEVRGTDQKDPGLGWGSPRGQTWANLRLQLRGKQVAGEYAVQT